MSTEDEGFLPFLKLNAGHDERGVRDYEWDLLQALKKCDDCILGVRVVGDPDDDRADDVVHILVSPQCSREKLAASLRMSEIKALPKHAPRDEPGHYVSVNVDQLGRAQRSAYYDRLVALTEGARTRQVTPEEAEQIARIREADSGSVSAGEGTRTSDRFFPVGDMPPEDRPERMADWRVLRQLQKLLTPKSGNGPGAPRPLFHHGRVAQESLQIVVYKSNLTSVRVILGAAGIARSDVPSVDELTERLPASGKINKDSHCVISISKAKFETYLSGPRVPGRV